MAKAPGHPIKIHQETMKKIRLAGAIMRQTQQEVVDQAVTEYIANHRQEFEERLADAKRLLLGEDQPS